MVELSNINSVENKEKTNINLEINTIISDFSFKVKEKNIDIKFIEKFNKELVINKQYFYILFSNLL
ncbi:hypothetical protein HOG21_05460 [bacterium]|nr:hypothetical protein [bacterium]